MPCFAHIIDNNLGDKVCCPVNYFIFDHCYEIDFRDVKMDYHDVVIVGGGGMLYPGVDEWIYEVSKKRKTIVWGIGLNYSDNLRMKDVRERLSKCALVGVRNKKLAEENGYEYVPCPSCLSKEFDDKFTPKEELGIYEHLYHPIDIKPSWIPRINNSTNKTFKDALNFLKRFKKIITNSYHGSFWCNLLGIKNEIYHPFSNRFDDIPTDSIEDCRKLNYSFHEKVMKLL